MSMTESDTPQPNPYDPLQAQTHRERMEADEQEHRQQMERRINFTANGLAFCIVIGFFTIIGVAILGYADITNATVSAFIGTALGYVVGNLAPVSQFYYRPKIVEAPAANQAPPPPPDRMV